jgi:hypothetical protein
MLLARVSRRAFFSGLVFGIPGAAAAQRIMKASIQFDRAKNKPHH